MTKRKEIVKHLIEKGENGARINIYFDRAIMILIILNVLALIIESFQGLNSPYVSTLRIFEIISVIIFSLEYILRIYIADITHPSNKRYKSILKFIFSVYGLIDLIAILPFFLPFIIKVDLRFLRILRLARVFRILKINRYSNSVSIIVDVFREKKSELAITGFIAMLILLVSSFLMYYIEGNVQPDKFPNVLESFWWAIATLTTVGYGDIYPVTGLGKFISGIIAVLGIGIVALPTGIIGAAFMERITEDKEYNSTCPHCGKKINH